MNPNMAIDPMAREFVLFHLAVKDRSHPAGWYIACVPHVPPEECSARPGKPWPVLRSDHPAAVTCPLCKKTDEFRLLARLNGVEVDEDGEAFGGTGNPPR